MSRFIRLAIQVGLGVALSIVCVILVLNSVDMRQVVDLLSRAAGLLMIVGVGATVVDVVLRAMRWRVLLGGIASIPLARVTAYMLVGYLANNVLPGRAGELIRSHYVGDRERVSRTAVLGTVLVERVLDVVVLLGICTLAWWIRGHSGALQGLLGFGAGATLLAALLLVGIATLPPEFPIVRTFVARAPRMATSTTINLRAGIRSVRAGLPSAVVLTLVAWLATTVVFGVAASAVGIQATVPQLLLLASATNLATAVPSAPGYVGTFEFAAVAAGSALGIPAGPALAVGILVHAAILFTTTVTGLVAVYVLTTQRSLALAPVSADDEGQPRRPDA